MRMRGLDLNKYLLPFFIWSVILYAASFFTSASWVISFFIIFPYLVFSNHPTYTPGLHIFDSPKFSAYSGGLTKKFIAISKGLAGSKFGKSVIEHERTHNKNRHIEIKYFFVFLYSLIVSGLIYNTVYPAIFVISLMFIFAANYLFVTALEIDADSSVSDKKILREYLSLQPKKSLCNKLRIYLLSR